MPSEKSLLTQEYYANPRNAFWKVMQSLTGTPWQAPYTRRIQALNAIGIALWDVVESCTRQGSLDANIRPTSITINAFAEFFATHPHLHWVGLNGGKAYDLFYRHLVKPGALPKSIAYAALPSTSPAYTLSLQDKTAIWRHHLIPYLANRQCDIF